MEQRSVQLRQELKVWEKSFSKDHDRKAGRDDIKANATIGTSFLLTMTSLHIYSNELSSCQV